MFTLGLVYCTGWKEDGIDLAGWVMPERTSRHSLNSTSGQLALSWTPFKIPLPFYSSFRASSFHRLLHWWIFTHWENLLGCSLCFICSQIHNTLHFVTSPPVRSYVVALPNFLHDLTWLSLVFYGFIFFLRLTNKSSFFKNLQPVVYCCQTVFQIILNINSHLTIACSEVIIMFVSFPQYLVSAL